MIALKYDGKCINVFPMRIKKVEIATNANRCFTALSASKNFTCMPENVCFSRTFYIFL